MSKYRRHCSYTYSLILNYKIVWEYINTVCGVYLIDLEKKNYMGRTVCFSTEGISSKSKSTSGRMSGPSFSSGKFLWEGLMKIRGKAV